MRNRCYNHLKVPKVRQNWSKYTLYNLQRLVAPQTQGRTFFQQKWSAKSLARGYHGEQVREGQWKRMFIRRPRSVIPMDARYLARHDGSDESAGRGSGLSQKDPKRPMPRLPYMQMTFAPLERRLDVAIFRALFASSTRQARQFVVHGAVTVNGKKMQYPGYMLNPGDLFQVDPERVMYATGAPKDAVQRRIGRKIKRRAGRTAEEADAEQKEEKPKEEGEESKEAEEEQEDPRETLKQLLSQAKGVMSKQKDAIPAKRRQDFRAFQRAVRRVLSRSSSSTVLTDNLEAQFLELKAILNNDIEASAAKTKAAEDSNTQQSSSADLAESAQGENIQELLDMYKKQTISSPESKQKSSEADLSDIDLDVLKEALTELQDNPIDSTKPYFTPWRPRDYMSAFAFVPRYLEVNHNICAAVFLRLPVVRPGRAEVPTPFNEQVNSSAFVWYLKRR